MTNATRTSPRRGLLIGAGYFSDFHLDAWQRLPDAEITCICDLDEVKARRAASKYGVPRIHTDVSAAIDRNDFDFVDIATAPAGRLDIVRLVAKRGLPIICQKPLAVDFEIAKQIVAIGKSSSVPFMVHENFRFQPSYREIKRLLDEGVIGRKLHTISMRTRLGDGWGEEAYLSRQPYFRTMPRLLVLETGVHFVDTFRYLAGEIVECSAALRRLNDQIVGEDAGVLNFHFANGGMGMWDANRYNESLSENPRYTFGDLLVEADGGSLWLDSDGTLTIKQLGKSTARQDYAHSRNGFAGDGVFATQQHFLDVLDGNDDFTVILAGSCSMATRQQISAFAEYGPILQLDVISAAANEAAFNRVVANAVAWCLQHRNQSAALITSSNDAKLVSEASSKLGQQKAALLAESLFATIARELAEQGVSRFVAAGGETSGAVINILKIRAVRIGHEIAPGVPWIRSIGTIKLSLALKSGNFGGRDFFRNAIRCKTIQSNYSEQRA